ncbi:CcdB family protein [Pseudorhodoferax sp. Leaf267]|uniref:CcdB family protein n=1 Tax=Pseudorhodoferax sp. Leaf267 TaxID=1736316 RepID=UPI0006F69210|nr:CcdB family protein [Pseudorhodoferax sp. Leaf267]KQP13084.1 hypothetical protein ASF43_18380 [Pseudorhodoferax sp. Leaf267]
MQYDVFDNPSPRTRDTYPYVLDIQSDLLRSLPTRMVAPLAATSLAASQLPSRLCPVIPINGRKLTLVPFEAAPLDKRFLKKSIANAKNRADDIVAAMDAVISGI